MLPELTATRYVTPLKEGGSLPGIVEADDDGTYVLKFRGAGQGLKVLVAEIIVAGIARLIEVPVPDLAVIDLDARIARYEADDDGTYVLKFRGAGQGLKVLVAEVLVAGIARLLDVPVPDLAVVRLDDARQRAALLERRHVADGSDLGQHPVSLVSARRRAGRPAPTAAGGRSRSPRR